MNPNSDIFSSGSSNHKYQVVTERGAFLRNIERIFTRSLAKVMEVYHFPQLSEILGNRSVYKSSIN